MGQRHPGDLGAAALGDLGGEAAQLRIADGGGGGLDQHPTQPAGSPAWQVCPRRVWALLVRSPGSARPSSTAAQGEGKRSIWGDLGDHGGGGHQPDPRDRQQPPCPGVAGECCARVGVGMLDLDGDGVDQPQAGVQPATRRSRHLQFGQPATPSRAEQGGELGDDAQVGAVLVGCRRRDGAAVDQGLPEGVDGRADSGRAGVVPDGRAEFAGGDRVVVVTEELRGQPVGARPASITDRATVQRREPTDGAGRGSRRRGGRRRACPAVRRWWCARGRGRRCRPGRRHGRRVRSPRR